MDKKKSKSNAKELVLEYLFLEQENTALETVYDWLFKQVANKE